MDERDKTANYDYDSLLLLFLRFVNYTMERRCWEEKRVAVEYPVRSGAGRRSCTLDGIQQWLYWEGEFFQC